MNFVKRLRMRARAAAHSLVSKALTLSGVDTNRGWFTLFNSNVDSTWQYDTTVSNDKIFTYGPIYACCTLIASDIGKICLRLMTQVQGVWQETTSNAFSPLLRKPNHYQTRQQFFETWVLSKFTRGNAYILKVRDARRVVVAMYVLDPDRVTPLVALDGSVYYQTRRDDLSKLPNDMPAIPASEIIHDRMECPFHPLVGVSPIIAAYLAAAQGMNILKQSEKFFKNMSRPSGMLVAPGEISPDTAAQMKTQWEENYGGNNAGRTAVLGNGLKYEGISQTAEEAELVDQLKLSGEQVCSVFHVPSYMVGIGTTPAYTNVQALNQQYYSQCLQKIFNAIEDLIDDGLGLQPLGYRTEFELDDLLRMDSTAQMTTLTESVKGSVRTPNEARAKLGLAPIAGGDSVYLQQQNYSLEALAKRDAKADPFMTSKPPALPAPTEPEPDQTDEAKLAFVECRKSMPPLWDDREAA